VAKGGGPKKPTPGTGPRGKSRKQGSLKDLFDKTDGLVSRDIDELAKRFPQTLGKALQELEAGVVAAKKSIHDSAEAGAASEDQLTQTSERITEALRDIAKATEETVNSQVVTAKKAEEMAKALSLTTESIKREQKGIAKGRTAQDEKEAKAGRGGVFGVHSRRKFFGGQLGVGEDSPFSFLMKASKKDMLKGGAAAAARGGAGALAELGPLSGMARVAGPLGIGIAALVGTITTAFNKRRQVLAQSTEHALAFGPTEGEGAFVKEAEHVQKAITAAGVAAIKFGQDQEASKTAAVKLATETGKGWKEAGVAMASVNKLAMVGGGTVEEVAEAVIKKNRETGRSLSDITTEMESLVVDAANVGAQLGDRKRGVLFRDHLNAVKQLAEGMNALTVNQKALSKAMSDNMFIAKNMGMSQDRAIRAAQGVTAALINPDQGFTAMRADDILNNFLAEAQSVPPEKRTDAQVKALKDALDIQQMRNEGTILPTQAAQMLRETGLLAEQSVMFGTLKDLTARGGTDVMSMAQAVLGKTDISKDEMMLIKQMGDVIQANPGVANMDQLKEQLGALPGVDPEKIDKMIEEMAEARGDPTALMNVSFEKFLQKTIDVLEPLLKMLTVITSKILSFIGDTEEDPAIAAALEAAGLSADAAETMSKDYIAQTAMAAGATETDKKLFRDQLAKKGLSATQIDQVFKGVLGDIEGGTSIDPALTWQDEVESYYDPIIAGKSTPYEWQSRIEDIFDAPMTTDEEDELLLQEANDELNWKQARLAQIEAQGFLGTSGNEFEEAKELRVSITELKDLFEQLANMRRAEELPIEDATEFSEDIRSEPLLVRNDGNGQSVAPGAVAIGDQTLTLLGPTASGEVEYEVTTKVRTPAAAADKLFARHDASTQSSAIRSTTGG
jgi:hypothetical protein